MKNIGKIVVSAFILLLVIVGCSNNMSTPTNKVEEFLGKYQSMDEDVLKQLDQVIKDDDTMNDDQKDKYKALMEKQYQNLSYKIENEDIEGNSATVDVEIEVLDYATTASKAQEYYNEHKEEIEEKYKDKKEDNDNSLEDAGDDVLQAVEESVAYINYKLEELETANDTVTYDMTFYLTKEDGEWILQDISDLDRKKLHGLYEG